MKKLRIFSIFSHIFGVIHIKSHGISNSSQAVQKVLCHTFVTLLLHITSHLFKDRALKTLQVRISLDQSAAEAG